MARYIYPESILSENENSFSSPFIKFEFFEFNVRPLDERIINTSENDIPEANVYTPYKSDHEIILYAPAGIGTNVNNVWDYTESIVTSTKFFEGSKNADDPSIFTTQLEKGIRQVYNNISKNTRNLIIPEGDLANTNRVFIPGQTLTYRGNTPQVLNLNFEMNPRTKKEATDVLKIINIFRIESQPNKNRFFLKTSDSYYIANPPKTVIPTLFLNPSNTKATSNSDSFYQYPDMVITSFDVKFNGDDIMQVFSDGKPTTIIMSLELKSLYNTYLDNENRSIGIPEFTETYTRGT